MDHTMLRSMKYNARKCCQKLNIFVSGHLCLGKDVRAVASRLMSTAVSNELIYFPMIFLKCGTNFSCRELSSIEMKGRGYLVWQATIWLDTSQGPLEMLHGLVGACWIILQKVCYISYISKAQFQPQVMMFCHLLKWGKSKHINMVW